MITIHSFRRIQLNAGQFALVSASQVKALSQPLPKSLALSALDIANSALAFFCGIYPSQSPYFWYGDGIELPWLNQYQIGTTDGMRLAFLPNIFEINQIARELKNLGICDLDGTPRTTVTFQSKTLCATEKLQVQGLAVETMLDVDEYLDHLLAGRTLEAIPWQTAAYVALVESITLCAELAS